MITILPYDRRMTGACTTSLARLQYLVANLPKPPVALTIAGSISPLAEAYVPTR